ncbi:facilitated trehalose transporter Tret1-like [Pieris brassicae]|uniref:facilitated trehalose transporter Tret1-like n=1 Tax=Pieris brassicae TaxID=7116 RepID=UPI001E662651|nr:facilitated trehalose transporter Tret1-like [Pieris brassicae]
MKSIISEGSQITQLICSLLTLIPVFSYGAAVGWMSPMTLLLQSENSPRSEPLTDIEISWMASIPYLITLPSAWLLVLIADKIGRKYAILLVSLSGLGTWAILLSSLETWALITARALVGISASGSYVVFPIYIKEIGEDSIRGSLGCLIGVFHTGGNLFLYVIGDMLDYYTVLWICLSLPISHLILLSMMPETPSFLLKKGEDERALKALAWLRCRSEDDVEVIKELEHTRREQENDAQSNKFLLKEIYNNKILFKAFRIALVAVLAREVCGAVPVLNFAGEIFTMASGGKELLLSPNQQAILLGSVQVVGSVFASSIVEKSGRKNLLFFTSLLSALSMGALATWFLLQDLEISATSWLPLATLCLCIFCDSAGLQPVSMVLAGEIFSFKYRGTVMGVTMSIAAFSDFLQLLFFKPLTNEIGIFAAFYFFAAVCFFISIYVILCIPETRARTLEDIYGDLRKKEKREIREKEATDI